MKIVKDNLEIVCDVKGCNNLASYKLILDVGGYESIRICQDCLKSFYNEASKKLRAKGINGDKNAK